MDSTEDKTLCFYFHRDVNGPNSVPAIDHTSSQPVDSQPLDTKVRADANLNELVAENLSDYIDQLKTDVASGTTTVNNVLETSATPKKHEQKSSEANGDLVQVTVEHDGVKSTRLFAIGTKISIRISGNRIDMQTCTDCAHKLPKCGAPRPIMVANDDDNNAVSEPTSLCASCKHKDNKNKKWFSLFRLFSRFIPCDVLPKRALKGKAHDKVPLVENPSKAGYVHSGKETAPLDTNNWKDAERHNDDDPYEWDFYDLGPKSTFNMKQNLL